MFWVVQFAGGGRPKAFADSESEDRNNFLKT